MRRVAYELPDGAGVILATYCDAEFCRDLCERFPTVVKDDPLDNVHYAMSALAEGIRTACAAARPGDANAMLDFLGAVLERDDLCSEIENAVAISFLEADELDALVLARPPPVRVRQILDEYRAHGAS